MNIYLVTLLVTCASVVAHISFSKSSFCSKWGIKTNNSINKYCNITNDTKSNNGTRILGTQYRYELKGIIEADPLNTDLNGNPTGGEWATVGFAFERKEVTGNYTNQVYVTWHFFGLIVIPTFHGCWGTDC
jgi:hypothetical protein